MTDAAGAADELGRAPFAERLAAALAGQPGDTSLVVGLYGPWGSGKSTILDYVEQAIEQHHDPRSVYFIKFNPWLYDNEQEIVRDFFATVARKLGSNLTGDKADIARRVSRLGEIAAGLSYSHAGVAVGGNLIKALGSFFAREHNLRELREDLKLLLEDELMGFRDVRIIVAIDDLDRTDADSIAATLRLVKLGASLPRISYVLAFDEKFVASALSAKYPLDSDDGTSFLEKIVQVPVHLPEADPSRLRGILFRDLLKLLAEHDIELSVSEQYELQTVLDDAVWPAVRTLRTGKRVMNAVAFAGPMMQGNVRIIDLILLESLRTLYPGVYKFIGSHKRVATEWVTDADLLSERRAALDAVISAVKADDQQHCKRLLRVLFPQVANFYSRRVDGTDDRERWGTEQRVCSPNYFDRYFLYSLPFGDVPDTDIDAVLRGTPERSRSDLTKLLGAHDPKLVIEKLIERGSTLVDEAALAVVQTLCDVADQLPDFEMGIHPISVVSRAAYVIGRLASRVSPGLRSSALPEMLKTTDIRFAVVIFRWIEGSTFENNPQTTPSPFSTSEILGIGSVLAKRILEADEIRSLYEGALTVVPTAIAMCRRYASGDALPGVVLQMLQASPAATINFLRLTLGASLDLGANSPSARAGYEYATWLVPPASLMDCLTTHFPALIGPFDETTAEEQLKLNLAKYPEADVHWVYRFAEIYRHYNDYPPLAPPSVYEPGAHRVSPFQSNHLQSSLQNNNSAPDFRVRVTLRVPDVLSLPSGISGTRGAQMYGSPRERELTDRLAKSPVTAWFGEWCARQGVAIGAGWQVHGTNSGEVTTLKLASADQDAAKRADLECMVSTGMASADRGGNTVEVPSMLLQLDFSVYGLGDAKLTLYGLAQVIIGMLGVIEPVEMIAQTLLGPSDYRQGELVCRFASPRERLGQIVDMGAFRIIVNNYSHREVEVYSDLPISSIYRDRSLAAAELPNEPLLRMGVEFVRKTLEFAGMREYIDFLHQLLPRLAEQSVVNEQESGTRWITR